MRCLAAIDVGYLNPGLVQITVTDDWILNRVEFFDKPDLSLYQHTVISRKDCLLHHSNELADKVDHFLQEYKSILDAAETILIEDQPPQGLTSIEQLLYHELPREKVKLVSPISMHAHHKIRHFDYDQRKVYTTNLLKKAIIETNPSLLLKWDTFDRQHDMADAFAFLLQYIDKQRSEWVKNEKREVAKTMTSDLEEYIYKPKSVNKKRSRVEFMGKTGNDILQNILTRENKRLKEK